MANWLVKFDIILGNDEYFVLDVGIDPPSRMLKKLSMKIKSTLKNIMLRNIYMAI